MDDMAGDRRDVDALKTGYGTDLFPIDIYMTYLQLNEITNRIAGGCLKYCMEDTKFKRAIVIYRMLGRCKHLMRVLAKQ